MEFNSFICNIPYSIGNHFNLPLIIFLLYLTALFINCNILLQYINCNIFVRHTLHSISLLITFLQFFLCASQCFHYRQHVFASTSPSVYLFQTPLKIYILTYLNLEEPLRKENVVQLQEKNFANYTHTRGQNGGSILNQFSVYLLFSLFLSPSIYPSSLSPLSLSFSLEWLFRGWFIATPDTLVKPRPCSHTQRQVQHTCAYTCTHIARRLCRTQGLIIHVINTPYHKESATGIGRIFHSGGINAIQLQLLLITDHLL